MFGREILTDRGQGGNGHADSGASPKYMSANSTRQARRLPFSVENGIRILVAPRALEPDVLDKMAFAAHSDALQQSGGGAVLRITCCRDAMEAIFREKKVEECADGFCSVPLPLKRAGEGVTDLRLASIVGQYLEGAISDDAGSAMELGSQLIPCSRHSGLGAFHTFQKGNGLIEGVRRRPRLISAPPPGRSDRPRRRADQIPGVAAAGGVPFSEQS